MSEPTCERCGGRGYTSCEPDGSDGELECDDCGGTWHIVGPSTNRQRQADLLDLYRDVLQSIMAKPRPSRGGSTRAHISYADDITDMVRAALAAEPGEGE